MTQPIGDIVAQRALETANGAHVLVELGRPASDGTAFGCTYRIGDGERQTTRTIYGEDSFQAMILAIKTIAVDLEHGSWQSKGALYWLAPEAGTGFPNPDVL